MRYYVSSIKYKLHVYCEDFLRFFYYLTQIDHCPDKWYDRHGWLGFKTSYLAQYLTDPCIGCNHSL